jgi:hypothetical protein
VGVLFGRALESDQGKTVLLRSPAAEVGCSAMYMTLLWKYSAS